MVLCELKEHFIVWYCRQSLSFEWQMAFGKHDHVTRSALHSTSDLEEEPEALVPKDTEVEATVVQEAGQNILNVEQRFSK